MTGTGLDHDELAGRLGEAGARDLQAATERSLDAMIALAAELGVPRAVRRTGSLWVAQDEHERAEIERVLSAAPAAGIPCRPAADLIPEPMRDRCDTAAYFPRDAELLPATWVRALAAAAADRGAALFEHSPVTGLERRGDGWAVHAGGGTVHAQAVVVACDGLIPRLLPQLDGVVYPVRGQVLATEPLQQGPLAYPTHSQSGFMYYRPTDDGRVVVGGGRLEQLEHEYTDAGDRDGRGAGPAGRVSGRVAGPRRRPGDPPLGRRSWASRPTCCRWWESYRTAPACTWPAATAASGTCSATSAAASPPT